MHIHCAIVSFQRQDLTERTIDSWLSTVTIPHSLVVVDNYSTFKTRKWLQTLDVDVLQLDRNYYPGFATNRGWELAPPETTMFQRSDNDTLYLEGWDVYLQTMFNSDSRLGQIGLWANGDEPWISMKSWPVGGNSVIRSALYNNGLRYTEVPWPLLKVIEEHQLTMDVHKRGYQHGWPVTPGIEYLGGGDPEYYRKSHADRGLSV